ncbi:MAG: hypothetical protein V9G19_03860 [Tetrasphaera sp.]
MNTPQPCWFCSDDRAGDGPPPGGWILQDTTWRAGHAPASFGPAGTVILQTRRHVRDQADFDAAELAGIGPVTARLIRAITAATGCARVYQLATMAGYPHFHVWLAPWWPGRGDRVGVSYLAALDDDATTEDAATRAAAQIAVRLSGG